MDVGAGFFNTATWKCALSIPATDAGPQDPVSVFRQLLIDKGVTAFGTWKSELPKIVFDSRFKILPTHTERRRVFDAFVKNRFGCAFPLAWCRPPVCVHVLACDTHIEGGGLSSQRQACFNLAQAA